MKYIKSFFRNIIESKILIPVAGLWLWLLGTSLGADALNHGKFTDLKEFPYFVIFFAVLSLWVIVSAGTSEMRYAPYNLMAKGDRDDYFAKLGNEIISEREKRLGYKDFEYFKR